MREKRTDTKRQKVVRINHASACGGCGVEEGHYHNWGCDLERCPFCNGQFISCDCHYKLLNLVDREKYDESTQYVPPEIYDHGLTAAQSAQWDKMLREKGRIRFIDYPIICVKCGKLWPNLFMAPSEEWKRYIQPDKQGEVICRECYDYIKAVIAEAERE